MSVFVWQQLLEIGPSSMSVMKLSVPYSEHERQCGTVYQELSFSWLKSNASVKLLWLLGGSSRVSILFISSIILKNGHMYAALTELQAV